MLSPVGKEILKVRGMYFFTTPASLQEEGSLQRERVGQAALVFCSPCSSHIRRPQRSGQETCFDGVAYTFEIIVHVEK